MSWYKFLDLREFYKSFGVSSLDQPQPARQNPEEEELTRDEVLKRLAVCSPLYAGTVTLDLQKYGMKSQLDQEFILRQQIDKWIQEIKQKKDCYYYIQVEYTKTHTPHAHILTNGYRTVFCRHFSPLGKNNIHKNSYQPVKHFHEYVKYMDKDEYHNWKLQIKKPLFG